MMEPSVWFQSRLRKQLAMLTVGLHVDVRSSVICVLDGRGNYLQTKSVRNGWGPLHEASRLRGLGCSAKRGIAGFLRLCPERPSPGGRRRPAERVRKSCAHSGGNLHCLTHLVRSNPLLTRRPASAREPPADGRKEGASLRTAVLPPSREVPSRPGQPQVVANNRATPRRVVLGVFSQPAARPVSNGFASLAGAGFEPATSGL